MDKMFLNISFSLLCGVFIIFALTFTGYILGLCINPFYTIIGIITTFALFNSGLYLPDKKFPQNVVFLNIIFALSLISLWMFAGTFPDLSYDGVGYHIPECHMLAHGHNPVYDRSGNIWARCYPKFAEIFAANIFSLTKNIEAGKIYNHLAAVIAFCYGFYVLSKERFRLNGTPFLKGIFAFLLVYNPVVICQIATYCNDGVLYLYFLIGALSILDYYTDKDGKKLPLLFFVMSSVILVNIKLGGLLCFVCFMALGLFFKDNIKKLKGFYLSVLVSIILILISGINPYFTNIRDGKHPFYPLTGDGKLDIMTTNTPIELRNKPVYHKFLYATFSKVNDTISGPHNVELKVPFTIHKGELETLEQAHIRVSGFGPWFSGIFIFSIVMLFMTRFRIKEDKKLFILMYALCFLPFILNPESWWARYIPYLWSLIVFIVMIFYINSNKKRQKIFCYFMIFLLFTNNFIIQVWNIRPFLEQNNDGYCMMKEFLTGKKCNESFY